MKKVLIAVLTLTMLISVASAASAAIGFTLRTPCESISDSELYKHVSPQTIYKYSGGNKFYVKHHVEETSAVETNRIAAYRVDTKKLWVQIGTVQILGSISACPMLL